MKSLPLRAPAASRPLLILLFGLLLAAGARADSAAPAGIVGEDGKAGGRPAGSQDTPGAAKKQTPLQTTPATGLSVVAADPNRARTADEQRAKIRDDLIKDVRSGKKSAADAAQALDDTPSTEKNSPRGRLVLGQEAVQVGVRLADSRQVAQSAEFFSRAEQALQQAADQFGADDAAGHAEALYTLAFLHTEYLGKKIQGYREAVAALALAPKHAGALSLKSQLERQYPNIKDAKLPGESN